MIGFYMGLELAGLVYCVSVLRERWGDVRYDVECVLFNVNTYLNGDLVY